VVAGSGEVQVQQACALTLRGQDQRQGRGNDALSRASLATGHGNDPFDSGAGNAIRTFQDMFNYIPSEIVDVVYGSAEGRRDPKQPRSDGEGVRAGEEAGGGIELDASGPSEP